MKAYLCILFSFGALSCGVLAEETPVSEETKTTAETAAAFRYAFEAEEFDKLPFYGNWYHKAGLGWYTKEHRHASGRAIVVCDDLNPDAAMSKRLEPPIPPGEVKIFVRVALMRMGPGNQVKVSLGNFEGETFVEEESVHFRWRLGNGFGWIGQNLDLKKTCSVLWVSPVSIGCRGIGDVPEVPEAQIILDSFVLTNERLARLIPDPTGRGRTNLELPEQPVEAEQAPSPEAGKGLYPAVLALKSSFRALGEEEAEREQLGAPPRPASVPEGNLVPNGSFEYSLKPCWLAMANYSHGYDIDIENQDPERATHGRFCLRLPLTSMNFMQTEGAQTYGADILCQPFAVKPETDYWVSFNARSSRPGVTLASRVGAFKLDVKWNRLTARVKTGQQQANFSLNFVARSSEANDVVWLDEVEMKEVAPNAAESKSPPAKFDVWGQFEVGLRLDAPGAVFYDDSPVELTIVAANSRMADQKDTLQFRLLDSRGEIVQKRAFSVSVLPYDVREEKIDLGVCRRGAFLAVYWLEKASLPAGKLAFCVVPNPEKAFGKKPFVGTYAQSVEAAMKLCARIGFDWNAPLNDQIFNAKYVSKRAGEYQWFDHLVKRWRDHGVDFVGEILPNERPSWDEGILGTEPAAGVSQPFFLLDNWRAHVRALVGHYKDTSYWVLADEAEVQRTAKDFAPYAKVAYEEVKQVNRDARVMFSASSNLMEEVHKLLGTDKVQDVCGGSRFMVGKWVHKRDLEFCRRYNLPIWHTGLGYPSFWLYDLLDEHDRMAESRRVELRRRLNEQAFDLMLQTAIVEPERYCLYTGKFDGGRDPYSCFAPDGSFRPHAVQYVNSLQFLRGVQKGALLRLQNASFIEAFYFTKAEWTYVALNSVARRGDYRISITGRPQEISVLDRDFNPLSAVPDNEELLFDLPADDLRILRDTSGRRAQFLDTVRLLRVEPYFCVRHIVLPGDDQRNYVGLSLAGRPLGARTDSGTLTVFGQTVKVELKQMPQTYVFRLPNTFGTRPITNLPLEYRLEMADGALYTDNYPMWAITAPPEGRFPVKLDGDLGEWEGHTPIFIYASQALDGSYRTMQARIGGHLVRELGDCSARVWARWTPDHLLIAADVLDDDLQFVSFRGEPGRPGDQVIFCFDTDLLGDLHHGGPDADDFKLIIGPGFPQEQKARWIAADGRERTIDIHGGATDTGYRLEFALPWELLGNFRSQVLCNPGRAPVLGFDVILRDADASTLIESELAWSGHDGAEDDPLAYGQLTLLPGYQNDLKALMAKVDKEDKRTTEPKSGSGPSQAVPPHDTAAAADGVQPPVAPVKETEVEAPPAERKGMWRRLFGKDKKEQPSEENGVKEVRKPLKRQKPATEAGSAEPVASAVEEVQPVTPEAAQPETKEPSAEQKGERRLFGKAKAEPEIEEGHVKEVPRPIERHEAAPAAQPTQAEAAPPAAADEPAEREAEEKPEKGKLGFFRRLFGPRKDEPSEGK